MRRKDLLKCQVYTRRGKKGFCNCGQARKDGALVRQAQLLPHHRHVTLRGAAASQGALHVPPSLQGMSSSLQGAPWCPMPRVPHAQGSLCGSPCHSPVVWGKGSVGRDQSPGVQGWRGMREGILLLPRGSNLLGGNKLLGPWGGQGQWMRKLGPAQALLVTGRSGGRCRAGPGPRPTSHPRPPRHSAPEPLCGVEAGWLSRKARRQVQFVFP